MKKTKEQKEIKGITLISLVISIIILLILATISIQSLTNTGIFKKASEAKNAMENAEKEQALMLNEYENSLETMNAKEVSISLEGAAKEKISIYDDNTLIMTTTLNSEGKSEQNITVPIKKIKFIGSFSGYEKTVEVTDKTNKIKVMPEGTLYWYGNECIDITGGWDKTCNNWKDPNGWFTGVYLGENKANYMDISPYYYHGNDRNVFIYRRTQNKIDTSSYTKVHFKYFTNTNCYITISNNTNGTDFSGDIENVDVTANGTNDVSQFIKFANKGYITTIAQNWNNTQPICNIHYIFFE